MTIQKTKSSTYSIRKSAKIGAKSKFLIVALIFLAGCVVNFKNPAPKTKGIIHVDTHYLYPGRNEFSTYNKFYKKEVAPGRFAETKTIELDPGQQLLVLNRALVLRFFEMPDSFFHDGHTPEPQQFIVFRQIRWIRLSAGPARSMACIRRGIISMNLWSLSIPS